MLKQESQVVITGRDIEIFTYLNEQKYMMANQIYGAFWPECDVSSGTARQRLDKLVSAGYVNVLDIQKDKKAKFKLFLLARKGIDVLRAKGLDHGMGEATDINHYTIEHTLKLATLRCVFRSLGQMNWKSERLIRREDFRREFFPDAILEINGLKIAIELENSFRGKERYVTRFEKYKKLDEFALVIYILSWTMVKTWLLDIEMPQNKLCFLLYDDLLNKKGAAELINKTSSVPLSSILE